MPQGRRPRTCAGSARCWRTWRAARSQAATRRPGQRPRRPRARWLLRWTARPRALGGRGVLKSWMLCSAASQGCEAAGPRCKGCRVRVATRSSDQASSRGVRLHASCRAGCHARRACSAAAAERVAHVSDALHARAAQGSIAAVSTCGVAGGWSNAARWRCAQAATYGALRWRPCCARCCCRRSCTGTTPRDAGSGSMPRRRCCRWGARGMRTAHRARRHGVGDDTRAECVDAHTVAAHMLQHQMQ